MTVKELINKLQDVDEDLTVVIDDADTNWTLKLPDDGVYEMDNYLVLSASYRDEINRDKR